MTRRANPAAKRTATQKLANRAASAGFAYRALYVALNRDCGWDFARARVRVVVRARSLDRAVARARDLEVDLDLDLDLVARAFDLALDLARDRDRVVRGHQSVRGVMVALDRLAQVARKRAKELDRHAAPRPRAQRSGQERPSPRSLRLTTTAARLLPPAHRSRWREEYHAELYDLAAAGASRRAQLAYAVRVLTRAWAQRRALTALHPGRERAR